MTTEHARSYDTHMMIEDLNAGGMNTKNSPRISKDLIDPRSEDTRDMVNAIAQRELEEAAAHGKAILEAHIVSTEAGIAELMKKLQDSTDDQPEVSLPLSERIMQRLQSIRAAFKRWDEALEVASQQRETAGSGINIL